MISSTTEQMVAKAVVDKTAVEIKVILEEAELDQKPIMNNECGCYKHCIN